MIFIGDYTEPSKKRKRAVAKGASTYWSKIRKSAKSKHPSSTGSDIENKDSAFEDGADDDAGVGDDSARSDTNKDEQSWGYTPSPNPLALFQPRRHLPLHLYALKIWMGRRFWRRLPARLCQDRCEGADPYYCYPQEAGQDHFHRAVLSWGAFSAIVNLLRLILKDLLPKNASGVKAELKAFRPHSWWLEGKLIATDRFREKLAKDTDAEEANCAAMGAKKVPRITLGCEAFSPFFP
uniref:Uncharacterized protein n=1 Tax=Oryza punctata TaxID=4537 RepID=A0A0E0MM42_ORYPU